MSVIAAAVLAVLCFIAATALSSAPSLPTMPTPGAGEVRQGRGVALQLAAAITADGAPSRVQLSQRELDAAASLANYGLDWVRIRPSIDPDVLTVEASLRLAERTWLNIEANVSPAEGFPNFQARIGSWLLPSWVIRSGMRFGDAFIRWRGHELPPFDTMIRHLTLQDNAAAATLAVPERMLRVARELAGQAQPKVDPTLLRDIYGGLLSEKVQASDLSLAARLRRVFSARPEGADAAEYNRAALVALAMYGVSPKVRRLAGPNQLVQVPGGGPTPELTLGGRTDLAKHFLLSAAMAATIDPHFTRAMGEWKELDDSLPGGSGFSFVDLTADRAGLHLARAAVDPDRAEAVAALLAQATDAQLFPAAAHRLQEGLADAEFRKSYGGLDTMTYADAVRRVDRLLKRLPLYAPLIPAS